MSKLPEIIINSLVNQIQLLNDKYETTYFDVENQIRETQSNLSTLIDELEGDEFDMKGLSELKSLLSGE